MNYSIRRLRPGDAADIARAANHEETAVNLRHAVPYPYLLRDAADFISRVQSDDSPMTARAICTDDTLVGMVILQKGEGPHQGSAELTYFVHPAFRGRGLAARAVRDTATEALADGDLLRIYAVPYADNRASCRVLEKAGFVCEAHQRHGALREGKPADTRIYAVTRD